MEDKIIRIGGASGYWGDADLALPQLLGAGDLDAIVFDYLAEITMSIMARARAKDPEQGYATDFVRFALQPNLQEIARQGVKILSNAGGVNARACGRAVEKAIADAGLDLKVAVITGDDLFADASKLAQASVKEMFSGADMPPADKIASINAYLGAFPVAKALEEGADIVITGRCVDSALTLGACIHAFGWSREDNDKLAAGSLAGHILECGAQATGGNFTDWEDAGDIADIGYPIAEILPSGDFTCTKPAGTAGVVSVGTIGEQMLYEISDPQAYMLPDVVCDFSNVTLEATGPDKVLVRGAKGAPAPDNYKVCATYADGWRAGTVLFFYGEEASRKARIFGDAAIERARKRLRAHNAPDYDETIVEVVGDESHYGVEACVSGAREVAVKIAAKHAYDLGAGLLLKEIVGLGLATPPGLCGFSGGRPKPSPVMRLFSFLYPKANITIQLSMDGETTTLPVEAGAPFVAPLERPVPQTPASMPTMTTAPLIRLAYGRSGDKGDLANIGILPRRKEFAPWIWAALTEAEVGRRFQHFLNGRVERYFLPGTGAVNFVLHEVLGGGGVASLRNDPQGKGYAQILLQTPIPIPQSLLES